MPRNIEDDIVSLSLHQLRQKYPTYSIRCGVLLVREDDGKVLIVREKPRADFVGGLVGMPKGSALRTDYGYFDAAQRELFEETGISIDCAEITPVEFIIFNRFFREILFVFAAIAHNPRIPEPDLNEITECQWVSLSEMHQAIMTGSAAYMKCLAATLLHNITHGISRCDSSRGDSAI